MKKKVITVKHNCWKCGKQYKISVEECLECGHLESWNNRSCGCPLRDISDAIVYYNPEHSPLAQLGKHLKK